MRSAEKQTLFVTFYVKIPGKYFSTQKLYGRDQPIKDEMMKHALRKKELCESVMNVMDKVIPGRFRLRGMFLSEMYGILLFLAKRAYESQEIDRKEFITRLENAKVVLRESIEVKARKKISFTSSAEL